MRPSRLILVTALLAGCRVELSFQSPESAPYAAPVASVAPGAQQGLAVEVAPQPAPAEHHAAPHWGYDGEVGPEHWGSLSESWELCETGMRQSPIDLSDADATALSPIEFHYRPSDLAVVDNGHTIQVNYEEGSYAILRGRRYDLKQFHFHHPSEHTVNGKHLPMEVHLVHAADDGSLAVLGVFLRAGEANTLIDEIWGQLEEGHAAASHERMQIDAMDLLPRAADRRYFHYMGSLTTPPGTEGVNWNVFVSPRQMSSEQIETFGSLYPHNNRPVQERNGRDLYLGN